MRKHRLVELTLMLIPCFVWNGSVIVEEIKSLVVIDLPWVARIPVSQFCSPYHLTNKPRS